MGRSFSLFALVLGLACLVSLSSCKKERAPIAPTGDGTSNETACAEEEGLTLGIDEEVEPDVTCPGKEDIVLCYGRWAATCNTKGKVVSVENCRATDQVCSPGKCKGGECGGCVKCIPNSSRCGDKGERFVCNKTGSDWELAETCDEANGLRCSVSDGKCEDLCAAADRDASYVGCEYFAVPTASSQLALSGVDAHGLCQPFPFAVVIANTEGVPAQVAIESPNGILQKLVVKPGQSKAVNLPCSLPLRGAVIDDMGAAFPVPDLPSVLVKDSAHRITSNVPITVYQFNPLEFEGEGLDGKKIYSHTADASLLLPVHALSGNYRVMSRATLMNHLVPWQASDPEDTVSISGFVAIVGVEETPTEVEIISSAHTRASSSDALDPSVDNLPALEPGESFTVMLERGEVLQLSTDAPTSCDVGSEEGRPSGMLQYCAVPKSFDLIATQIRAKGKVQVISGHDCDFVPYDRWACDHLEETMFPVESWGKDVIMTISATSNCQKAPNMFRVLADSDDTQLRFTPDVHKKVTLKRGEFMEFQTDQAFEVSSNKAILVAQYLLGQDYEGSGSSGSFYKGDPSMSLGIPTEQWRKRYSFLIPSTYTDNFVNVIARQDQVVLLDQGLVSGYVPIEGTAFAVARVRVGPGSHVIDSDGVFGFVVYGFARYTSYMLPGGLDLHAINSPD